MRILSNDYLSNVSGSEITTKGGPPRFAADFSEYLIGHGHEWIGLVAASEADKMSLDAKEENERKRFVFTPKSSEGIGSFKALPDGADWKALFAEDGRYIEEKIAEVAPDVVFLNGFSAFNWIFANAAFTQGIPVVIQHAGIFIREVLMYKELFSPESQKACAQMEREVAEKAAANIFLNKSSEKAFDKLLPGVKSAHSVIIPLPHPGWKFEAVYAPEAREEKIIGAVARWDRIKNHDALLALAKEIKRQALPWRLRVVTKIPENANRAEFKAEYKKFVDVVDPMGREDLQKFYKEADVLALPSHFDVSPTVVMEALAEGKPTLIAPEVGWVSEYEEAGMQDWIIDYADATAVVERLKTQFTRASWPELAALASHVQSKHSPDAVYASYLELFTSLSASRTNS